MYPILSEKYILSKESYFGFTVDQNKKALDKNKKNLKLMSYLQVAVGVIFLIAMFLSGQEINIIFVVLAAALIITGLTGKSRSKGYDKKINESLESSYKTREYGDNSFKVDFYENKLNYSVSDQTDDLSYDDFVEIYEGETYFATHFCTGEVIIFNRSCNIEKIREILITYRENHPRVDSEDIYDDEIEASTEETILVDRDDKADIDTGKVNTDMDKINKPNIPFDTNDKKDIKEAQEKINV